MLFLFTDGEELGWLGAIAFNRGSPEIKPESVVLCFDALPGNAPLLLEETSPGDAWLLQQMAGLPISVWGGSWKRDQERNEQDTDFDTFAPAGFTGLVFENEASGTRYHTNRDTVDAISPNLVQTYGETMLTLTQRFGTVDLRTHTSGPDLTYFILPLVGLVAYPSWVMPLLSGFGLISLLGFVIIGWRKKQFSLGRFALCVLGLLVGIALIVVLAQVAWGIVLKKYILEVSTYGGFESSPIWLSTLMSGASIMMVLILSLLTRKLDGINVTVAASVIFLLLGFAFHMRGVSSNSLTLPWFAWPFLGCVTGLGILLLVRNPVWKLAVLLCSTFMLLAVTLPWIVLATYTREDAWLPVLVTSVWMALFAPQVEALFGQVLALENKTKALDQLLMETKISIIARGRNAEVVAWKDQQVLKLFYTWVSTEAIAREIQISRLVSTMDLPTPKILGETRLEDRHGLIYERVEGTSLLTMLSIRPWLCVQYGRQFAELHTAIHRQHGSELPPLKASLESTIRGLKCLPENLLEAALNQLASLPEDEKLCHLDYHPDQVMVTANGQSVLDWMTARCGPPAADVARTMVLLRFGPVMNASWLMQMLANLLRGTFSRAYLQRYLELNPAVTTALIDAWMPLLALARLAEDIPGEKGKLQAFLQKAFLR